MKDLAWIAAAGAAGTLCRYGASGLAQRWLGANFPWGTLLVNTLGCTLFGLVWGLSEERLLISGHTRFLVLTGFMGAFTTFSTFAFETSDMLRDSEWGLAIGNLLCHNLLGVAAVVLGITISRLV